MSESEIKKTQEFLDSIRFIPISEQQVRSREIEHAFKIMINTDEDTFAKAFSHILLTPRMLYIAAHSERYRQTKGKNWPWPDTTEIGVGHG